MAIKNPRQIVFDSLWPREWLVPKEAEVRVSLPEDGLKVQVTLSLGAASASLHWQPETGWELGQIIAKGGFKDDKQKVCQVLELLAALETWGLLGGPSWPVKVVYRALGIRARK